MDLYFLILFLLCVAGTAAVMTQTHFHGLTQFAVYAGMVLVTGATGAVAFLGGGMPHWLLFLAKVLVVCGACFGSYLAAHHFSHHHRPVMAFMSWFVGIIVAIGILFYSPGQGIRAPIDGMVTPPPIVSATGDEDEEDTGDMEEEPAPTPVTAPPVVRPALAPVPVLMRRPIPANELPCSLRNPPTC
jgi:hypothetical protein